MATIVDTGIAASEHDVVRLVRALDQHRPGARGTLVAAHPEVDSYLVEVVEDDGRVLDTVEAHRADFQVVWRP